MTDNDEVELENNIEVNSSNSEVNSANNDLEEEKPNRERVRFAEFAKADNGNEIKTKVNNGNLDMVEKYIQEKESKGISRDSARQKVNAVSRSKLGSKSEKERFKRNHNKRFNNNQRRAQSKLNSNKAQKRAIKLAKELVNKNSPASESTQAPTRAQFQASARAQAPTRAQVRESARASALSQTTGTTNPFSNEARVRASKLGRRPKRDIRKFNAIPKFKGSPSRHLTKAEPYR